MSKQQEKDQKNYSVNKPNKKKPLSIVVDNDYKRRKKIKGEPTFIDEKAGYVYQVLDSGKKQLPAECPVCGETTEKYIFNGMVLDATQEITGVKCEKCRVCYFKANSYVQYFGAFRKLKRTTAESLRERLNATNDNRDKKKGPSPEQKEENNSKKPIYRSIEKGKIKATVLPRDKELPNKCDRCGEETRDLVYVVKENTGETKKLLGKECPLCGTIYYPLWLYSQNKLFFAEGNATNEETLVRKLIDKYLKSTNKNFIKDARKSLISTNEDIDWILRDYLSNSNGLDRRKILYVAVRRNPEKYLFDVWEEYKADPIEFDQVIGPMDFTDERFHDAAVELIGKIVPYPGSLLNKIPDDRVAQEKIYKEMKDGDFCKKYLRYISTNQELIKDVWVQEETLKKVQNKETFIKFIPYLDLCNDPGISYLNGIDDLAIITYILENTMTDLNKLEQETLSDYVRCALDFRVERMTASENDVMDDYFARIIGCPYEITKKNVSFSAFLDMLFSLAKSYEGYDLIEKIYQALVEVGMSLDNYEDLLGTYKCKEIFIRWLDRMNSLGMSPKHALAKKLLTCYPEHASLIFAEVEHSGDERFVKNVKIMAEELQIPWDVMDEQEYNYTRGIREKESISEAVLEVSEDIDTKNEVAAPVEESTTTESVDPEELYTDDFGNTFDLSELKHILDL